MTLRGFWRGLRRGGEGSRAWMAPFAALVLLLFLGDFAVAPGRSLLPVYAEAELGKPPYFTSTLLSVQVLFGAVSAFVGGGLADALGQKRVLILGASGLPIVGLVFLSGSPFALVALWVYIGLSLGLYTIGRQSYMMATVPTSFLGVATALIFTGSTLGGALGNAIGAPVVDRYGFRTMGIIIIVVGLLVFLASIFAMPDMRAGERKVKSDQSFAGYAAILRRPGVRAVALVRLLPTAYYGAASLLFPLLIYRVGSTLDVGRYATISLVFASACQLITGRICDRYGRAKITLMLTIGIATISLITTFITHSVLGLFVCGILGSGIAWSLSTVIPGLVSDTTPREEHGRGLGLMHIAWSFGYLAGTQVAGLLVDISSGLPFLFMGLLNLVTVITTLTLARRLQADRRACQPHSQP